MNFIECINVWKCGWKSKCNVNVLMLVNSTMLCLQVGNISIIEEIKTNGSVIVPKISF